MATAASEPADNMALSRHIGKKADCFAAYFSLNEDNKVIQAHCKRRLHMHGIAKNGYITKLKRGDRKMRTTHRYRLLPHLTSAASHSVYD